MRHMLRKTASPAPGYAPPCHRTGRTLPVAVRAQRAGGHQSGFTLVELMFTLIVAVVLIAIAVPSFRSITLSSRLTSTANEIVGAIQTARMEAIKRNASVQVCSDLAANNGSDTLGKACGTEMGAVFVDSGRLRVGPVIPESLKVSGSVQALRFSGAGIAHEVGESAPAAVTVVDICTSGMARENHRVIKIEAGSIVTTTTTTGACS